MPAMAQAMRMREIHSEPATIISNNSSASKPAALELPFDLPNVINGTYAQNVYRPVANEPLVSVKPVEFNNDDDDITSMLRTVSAHSLPVSSTSALADLTPYERALHALANDPAVQKEIALGKRIGFYRLGKELGAGNFSKVKLGVHVLTKEKVAVKIMEKAKMDQKAQRLLAREIQSMELLHHPNVIRLFECVETISRTFLVMEYAGGGELYAYVHEKGKLNEHDCRPLFAQIVSAVAHMHSKNIVHRDIKAENVIFSHPGWVKLADFGFSCQIESGAGLSTFCGSPPYAAPELFKDQEYQGPMVDVWALGVLLYFMLVGITPFRGETVNDLKQNILAGTYPMPEYLSAFAQHSISRMLDLNPEKRLTVNDIKRTYWLRESKFTKSYIQCSTVPNEEELKRSSVARNVWQQLQHYGIDEKLLKESANKGARNSIIGTYRIVLYQAQAEDDDKERNRIKDHVLLQQADRNRRAAPLLSSRSKTCTIF